MILQAVTPWQGTSYISISERQRLSIFTSPCDVWRCMVKDIQVLDALLIELNELLEKANAANRNWKDMWLQSSVCILKSPFAKVCRFIESPKTNIYHLMLWQEIDVPLFQNLTLTYFSYFSRFSHFRHSCFWCRTLGNLLRQVPMAPSTARSPSPVPDTQVDAAVGPGPGRNLKVTISLIQRECLEHILYNWMYSNNISYMHMQMYITAIFQTKPFPRDFFFACSMIHIYSICILHMYCLPFKPLSCSHLKSKNHWKFCSESSVELRSKIRPTFGPRSEVPNAVRSEVHRPTQLVHCP